MLYQSPVGLLKIIVGAEFLNEILFMDNETGDIHDENNSETSAENPVLASAIKLQLDEYFLGKRKTFDIPIKQDGTVFQSLVWNELIKIPFGKTISYLQLSRQIGNVKSIRAVGAANGRNHLPIIVPCHRVIGSNGSLIGYAGGLWRKQWLLEHENKFGNGIHLLF